ncbi:hypothetical protein ABH930_006487 [Kitasatospora sp. GAS204A]|uniref:hypothetical protein n=1 Tax=unclassified Kitasatospora TaxID=2633591 RepID=UPI00247667A2|nr:hypothetical protein [Kitasatospora sp. GAS204B]MDH6121337.1 hypothetical protein [Kitasatospora sp. GAS204B]
MATTTRADGTAPARLRSRPLLAAATGAGAACYGAAISWIPSPDDPRVFWVSNLFAPWLAIAFFAGRLQRSWHWAVAAGTLAEFACLIAFYARQFGSGLSVAGWLHYIFRGSPPWGLIALPVGVVYGLLGSRYAGTRSVAAGACLSLALVAEPWAWPLYEGFRRGPLVLWIVETAVGVLATGWLFLARRRSASPGGPRG